MLIAVVKFSSLILLTICSSSKGVENASRPNDETLMPHCPDGWFKCSNGKCITGFWVCDGTNDCGNLEDEKDCDWKMRIPEPCLSSQFKCESDNHCIPEKWRCDGDADCTDRSDETNCDNVTTCTGFWCSDGHCIPSKWQCDKVKDCSDGSDEELCNEVKLCSDSEFICSSGSCVNQTLVCNGKNDCVDGSDEGPHCVDPCDNHTCSQHCKSTPSGPRCYCDDGFALDEKDNKTCKDIDECEQDGFCSHACINSPGSYECVCNDGYELVNKTCRATVNLCSDSEFVCSSGSCVNQTLVCNGKNDCVDGSDEGPHCVDPCDNHTCSQHCKSTPSGPQCYCGDGFALDKKDNKTCKDDSSCKPGEVWCSPGKLCISENYICDGKNDCIDGSDEKHCGISSIIARENGTELLFMAEGPNIYVGVPNAAGYHFTHETSSLGSDAVITSLSYDSKSQTLFISEANRPAIYALSAVSSGVRELVVDQITSPKDTGFDCLSNNLYWVDSIKGTVEVISVNNQKRIILLERLATPVSIALSPHRDNMFVSTIGDENCLTVYRMDGKDKRIIHSIQGVPMSLVMHPSKTILYWTDSRAGMIMYVNYTGSSSPWVLKSGINGVMSVAVSEDNIYWTVREMINPVVDGNIFINKLSDQTDQSTWKSIVLSEKKPFSGKSECLTENNGGCSYLCLTSQTGRTCSCSSAMKLARDGKTCLGKRCEEVDFSCSDGQCIPSERKCDGSIDCSDRSDESNCTKQNSRVEPFKYESKKIT